MGRERCLGVKDQSGNFSQNEQQIDDEGPGPGSSHGDSGAGWTGSSDRRAVTERRTRHGWS